MTHESQYGEAVVESMESVYGEGFLSPGGAAEVADILDGLDLQGRDVLDLGCGLGGASILFVRDLGAARVHGVDLEEASLERAAAAVEAAGLADRITLQKIAPGPLPLPDRRFDLVFTKDVMCHVADKAAFVAEVFRVLRPGGVFATGDWVKGPEGPGSEAFEDWWARLGATGLIFHFHPEETYRAGLDAAGFEAVEVREHSAWSERQTRQQLEQALGPARESLLQTLGADGYETRVYLNRTRMEALAGGALRHCHLRARRPG
jgi:phosphoethanolamine N-methyltransferase